MVAVEPRTVYLVRHGEIELPDDARRFIGQLDLPLNEAGIRQARLLRQLLDRAELSAVYCSDLARSRQTAELIAGPNGPAVIPRSDLREISLGEWEGCTFAEIAERFPQAFAARGRDIEFFRVPGGESFADCSRRVLIAFHHILANSSGNVLIAGHAGVNRLVLGQLLGLPVANLFRLGQDYGCLNVIRVGRAGYEVKLLNYREIP